MIQENRMVHPHQHFQRILPHALFSQFLGQSSKWAFPPLDITFFNNFSKFYTLLFSVNCKGMKYSVLCQDFRWGPDHIRRRPKTFKNPIKDYRGFSSSQFQSSASVLCQVQVKLFDSCFSLIGWSLFFLLFHIFSKMCLLFVFIFPHARRAKLVRRRRLGRGSFRSAGFESGQIFFINLTTPEWVESTVFLSPLGKFPLSIPPCFFLCTLSA